MRQGIALQERTESPTGYWNNVEDRKEGVENDISACSGGGSQRPTEYLGEIIDQHEANKRGSIILLAVLAGQLMLAGSWVG